MTNREKLLSDLEQAITASAPASTAPQVTVTDPSGYVTIVADGASAQVSVNRALAPDPDRRGDLESAASAAVSALLEQIARDQIALGHGIGDALGHHAAAEMAEPQAALDDQVRRLKERMQAASDRAARRRDRK